MEEIKKKKPKPPKAPRKPGRAKQAIEHIFFTHYKLGELEFEFRREELTQALETLGLDPLANIGDTPYSFRYRGRLPKAVLDTAPEGMEWIIRGAGDARYRFCLVPEFKIQPNPMLVETKIPDATPSIISRYALDDEQSTLAKVRFNRLIDLFTGLTCYPLQSHLRTKIKEIGQTETDDVYVGLDRRGVHYVLPVQAKGKGDRLGIIQIEQDIAMAQLKFSSLTCKPIGAQSMKNGAIALFEFESSPEGIRLYSEKHYRLVPSSELSVDELEEYRRRTE
jgi:hypothetical protein